MRRFFCFLGLGLLVAVSGCFKSNTLPTGAINTFDADSYQTLMTAQATLNSFKAQEPTIVVTVPAFKTVLNQAIADYNVAEGAWQTYHAGGGNSAAVTAALTTLAVDITKLAGLIPAS